MELDARPPGLKALNLYRSILAGLKTRFPGLKVRGWHSLSSSLIQYGKISAGQFVAPKYVETRDPELTSWAGPGEPGATNTGPIPILHSHCPCSDARCRGETVPHRGNSYRICGCYEIKKVTFTAAVTIGCRSCKLRPRVTLGRGAGQESPCKLPPVRRTRRQRNFIPRSPAGESLLHLRSFEPEDFLCQLPCAVFCLRS
jgi:hypothetical protein